MPPAVLITGGARRIGAAIARAFGRAGWHVVIHHRNSHDEADALARELPSSEVVACELADGGSAAAMVGELAGRLGDWRVIINNASVFRHDDTAQLDPVIFTEAMAVNAKAPVRMAQAFLAQARAPGGRRVIQLTDQKLINPNPDFLSYTMSKQALAATIPMMAMAAENPDDRVYGLAPGASLPSFDQAEAEHEVSGRLNLLERLTDPQELAQAALWLSQGWLASGQTLYVDSGLHLVPSPRDVLFMARARVIEAFLASIAVVALAEIGDKTMLLAIVLATRLRAPWQILAGIFAATLANHALAALLGQQVAGLVDAPWFRAAVALGFIAMAAWTLVPDKLDEEDGGFKQRGSAFVTTLVAFFLVEMGDKTQVATIALGAQYNSVLTVAAGTTLGMMLANTPAVFLGEELVKRVSLRATRIAAALLFLVLGLWQLAQLA